MFSSTPSSSKDYWLYPTSAVWNCRKTRSFVLYLHLQETMMQGKFTFPDLDVLDSPLLSAAPLTAVFSNIPGSAIAEKIFNDPESWGDDEDDRDFPEDVDADQVAWLTEELEKVRGKAAGIGHHDSKPNSLLASPPIALASRLLKRDSSIAWKGTGLGKRGAVRPISLAALFEHSTEDFSGEIQQQLSKILESGNIPHHIRYPHSSALSPPSTGGTSSTLDSPLQIQTASSIGNGGDRSPSPVTIYSASATLSFLEWYGIYPDSPRLDLSAMRSIQPRSARLKAAPALQIPSSRRPSRPPSTLENPETPVARKVTNRRSSSVPPPGLDVPADVVPIMRPATPPAPARTRTPTPPPLTRSPSPTLIQPQPVQAVVAGNPPVRPTHMRTDSLGVEHGQSQVRRQSPQHTQSLQRSDSGPGSRRRLPSIPPESKPCSRSSTPVPAVQQPLPRSQNPISMPAYSNLSAAVQDPIIQQAQLQSLRPAVRSPQCGPAGPRTRGRGSRDSAGTPGMSAGAMVHRPPVLRL